jgi:translation initiation factor 1
MSKPKNRTGVVYSTNPDFEYGDQQAQEMADIPFSQQKLKVSLDRSGRAGKTVTLIENFSGSFQALEKLGKELKNHCGTGGSAKDYEILIQGDQRKKVAEYLQKKGASVKLIS